MAKRNENTEIEAGDIVEVVSVLDQDSKFAIGMHGVFDMHWSKDGVATFTVLFDENGADDFAYATEVKLVKKAK